MGLIHDEAGSLILDEGGVNAIADEAGDITPTGPPVVFLPPPPPWLAFAVGPSTGNAPTQPVTSFTGLRLLDSLTAGPTVSFTIPGRSPAALVTDGLATDVWVYFKQVKKWRCRVLPIEQVWGESGEDEASISSVGYRQVVEARHIVTGPPVFNNVDQGLIVWNLVQHAQTQPGGDLGISQGAVLTGQLRDRTQYKIGDQLGGLIKALGEVINGIWWGVDADKVLTVRLWSSFVAVGTPIVHGQNAITVKRSRALFANAAGVVGAANVTVPSWRVATGIATDPRGRWEVFDASHSSVIDQTQIDEYADGLLAENANPPTTWTATIDPVAFFDGDSRYSVGDVVSIVVPRSAVDEISVVPVNVTAMITEVQIASDDAGDVSVTIAAVEVGP